MGLRNERRQEGRVPMRLALTEHVGGKAVPSMAVELSEQGATVVGLANDGPPRGELALELALPGTGEPIWTLAEPRWMAVRGALRRVGVRFVDMDRGHQRLLRDYVVDRRLRALEPRPPRSWLAPLRRLLAFVRRRLRPGAPVRA